MVNGTMAQGGGPRKARQRGAVLVEAAIAAPLLFLLIFGMIEFGWIFYQYQDIRQGAREGARIAAVAESSTGAQIVSATCDRMEENGSGTTVTLSRPGSGSPASVGDEATLVVARSFNTLSGFLDPILGSSRTEDSTVHFRIEEPVIWSATTGACP